MNVVCTCDKQVWNTSSNLISTFESKCVARCNQKEHAEQGSFFPVTREVVACQKKIRMEKKVCKAVPLSHCDWLILLSTLQTFLFLVCVQTTIQKIGVSKFLLLLLLF